MTLDGVELGTGRTEGEQEYWLDDSPAKCAPLPEQPTLRAPLEAGETVCPRVVVRNSALVSYPFWCQDNAWRFLGLLGDTPELGLAPPTGAWGDWPGTVGGPLRIWGADSWGSGPRGSHLPGEPRGWVIGVFGAVVIAGALGAVVSG